MAEKQHLQGIATYITEPMDNDDGYYIIGPGTTTRTIMEDLGLKNTLLGVDVVRRKKLIANDVAEKQLLNFLSDIYLVQILLFQSYFRNRVKLNSTLHFLNLVFSTDGLYLD